MSIKDKAILKPTLAGADLTRTSFSMNAQFHFKLSNHDVVNVEKIVRLIPKKRMVVFGEWRGKKIVGKLFLDKKQAKKKIDRDRNGITVLHDNKIPAPILYYKGETEDHHISVLLFERLLDGVSLKTLWDHRQQDEEVLPFLKKAVLEIATQHVLGVMQLDMHLDNFLLCGKTIYTLDGAQIRISHELLPKRRSLKNLALFLSQLGVGAKVCQFELLSFYANARGFRLSEEEIASFDLMIKQYDKKRWDRYHRKIFRTSTQFVPVKEETGFGMCDRRYFTEEMINFFKNPDLVFNDQKTIFLKKGRSATVAKFFMNERWFVVKRYNLKSLAHRLKRSLRSTRAYHAWRISHKLHLFGVSAAMPVGFFETRYFGLRGKSYFISEYVGKNHAGIYIEQHQDDSLKIKNFVEDILRLFRNLYKMSITHGDLKITNILLDENNKPVLIDLDGAKEYGNRFQLDRAWRNEIKRFLKNFVDKPPLLAEFNLAFNQKWQKETVNQQVRLEAAHLSESLSTSEEERF